VALSAGRRAAAETLTAVDRGRRLDLAFSQAAGRLPERDRRFAHELSYGVVRLRGRLDHLLSRCLHRELDALDAPVLDALRAGAYQLLYMAGVPAYAAVSQAVDQVRGAGVGSAAGLVNAVLRALGRAGDDEALFPPFETDPAGFLSSWGSHPRWLVERWLARWPAHEVRALIEADNRVPPLTFVPREAGARGLDEAAAAVEAAGGRAQPVGRGAGVLEVQGLDPSTLLERVAGFVQDPGAALVCRYAAAPPGGVVADLCAAPGGKSLYLARTATYVVAVDPSAARLGLLRDNVVRTGLRVGVVRGRAEAAPVGRADLVLVDAPCSGTGTLRRHPDARWRLEPDAPAGLARVQARLLEGAARVVPSGGLLVYSTCTLEPEENDGVVDAFLADQQDFEAAPPDDPGLEDVDARGRLSVLPQRTGFDGAFAARLRRR
jgi:16S rRNA (cytosine967-C5)-methyltransferase